MTLKVRAKILCRRFSSPAKIARINPTAPISSHKKKKKKESARSFIPYASPRARRVGRIRPASGARVRLNPSASSDRCTLGLVLAEQAARPRHRCSVCGRGLRPHRRGGGGGCLRSPHGTLAPRRVIAFIPRRGRAVRRVQAGRPVDAPTPASSLPIRLRRGARRS